MEAVTKSEDVQTPETTDEGAEISNDLGEPRWSVISFESVAVRNLTYDEAKIWLNKLSGQNISGLCIITDEAAARVLK